MPTLPEKSALDYDFLRQEGIRHLEDLAGPLWTDFNLHDPGITILEQLCYALTDLVYRCNYTLPDLLTRSGEDPYDSLYSPAQILSSQPVTLIDLRKLIVDVAGVNNAWIEPVMEPPLSLYYDEAKKELSLLSDSGAAEAVKLKGLYRVRIDSASSDAVTSRLHANRPLCEDFEEIRLLDPQNIQVHAHIEIGPLENPEAVLQEIYQKIAAYISPPIPFDTLSKVLAADKPIDEIFDGPRLEHGFIDTDALRRMERKTALRTSDLIREIMDVSGNRVRAVKDITLQLSGSQQKKNWSLDLDPQKTPRLDITDSELSLERKQLPLNLNKPQLQQLRDSPAKGNDPAHQQPAPEAPDLKPPPGRDRKVGNYYSLQHQFPAAYGIGELGLPASASQERKAQAKQLKAYLLFFDQLLANYFAQLAHVRELFGFRQETPHTYFANVIDDPGLGLDDIWMKELAAHKERLQQITENPYASPEATEPAIDWSRKNRFLDHLLARFAEQFSDYALRYEAAVEQRLTETKQAFLQQYPRLSGARGTAYNYLLPWGPDNLSGLEQRLRLKLGMTTLEEPFYLVEHILLRPLEGDRQQEAPLLANACRKDPYSLQLSLVFPDNPYKQPAFKQFVEQTVRQETPAHLTPYVHWLKKDDMAAFAAAYQDWLAKQHAYWTGNTTHIPLRDARDQLIDLLKIGQTYPLRDLAVKSPLMVAFKTPAKIPIANSQAEVSYQLFDEGGNAIGKPAQRDQDGNLLLETPPIEKKSLFKIQATKQKTNKFQFLLQVVEVEVVV